MVFRGPPAQVKAVADVHTKRGDVTFQTKPFRDGIEVKVDLYKVVDMEKFRKWQQSDVSVKFVDQTGAKQKKATRSSPPDSSEDGSVDKQVKVTLHNL